VSLEDICAEFSVSHRTAQRMTEALDAAFANVTTIDAEDRRRYWRLDAPPPERLQPRQETTIEALEIAARAAEFRFHPTQVLEPQDDGSLIVRFNAAGWLEMAWHLYQWGDKVEVIAPDELRALVEGYRRSDFDALP
jgi:predicted DNA-binding transcriptional regulator YafY